MAFPDTPMSNPITGDGQTINAASWQAYVVDPFNALAALLGDSGAQTLAFAAGFALHTIAVTYRKINGFVFFDGDVQPTSGSFAIGQNAAVFAVSLPVGFRPGSAISIPIVGGAGDSARLAITAAGAITLVNNSTIAQPYLALGGSASFFAEN